MCIIMYTRQMQWNLLDINRRKAHVKYELKNKLFNQYGRPFNVPSSQFTYIYSLYTLPKFFI